MDKQCGRCRGRPSSRAGVTLPEMLVVVVILAIAFVGVSGMFVGGYVSARKASNYTIAANRAVQEIERLRDAGFLGAVVDYQHFPSPKYHIASSTQVVFSVPDLKNGQGTITVALDPEAQSLDNLKRVNVTIVWGGGKQLSGRYSITTLVANRP